MSATQKPLDEVYAVVEDLLSKLNASLLVAIDIIKLRVSYWDKLALLNAGTIALSFSAASSFRGHATGDGGVGYLFAAWKLLIFSILVSLVAQWLATLAASHFLAFLTGRSTVINLGRLIDHARGAGVIIEEEQDHAVKTMGKTADKAVRYGGLLDHVALVAGFSSQIATTVAFVWLYRFARVNLAHL